MMHPPPWRPKYNEWSQYIGMERDPERWIRRMIRETFFDDYGHLKDIWFWGVYYTLVTISAMIAMMSFYAGARRR